jgi:hypothetical protein
MALKHVGRIKNNQRKVVVAYRTVPGDPEHCVVVTTENLMADEHDSLMKTVESNTGQSAYEFAEAMSRTQLPDGRNMLAGFHSTGRMMKVATTEVEMVPDRNSAIPLNELNQQIAEQKGVSVEDLAIGGGTTDQNQRQTTVETVDYDTPSNEPVEAQSADNALSDEEIAAKYRSDANRLFKEAKRLREEAEALVPTKKKSKETSGE